MPPRRSALDNDTLDRAAGNVPTAHIQLRVEVVTRSLGLLLVTRQAFQHHAVDDVQEATERKPQEIDATADVLTVELVPDSGLPDPAEESESGVVGRSEYCSKSHGTTFIMV